MISVRALAFIVNYLLCFMLLFSAVCVLYTQGMGNKEWREVSVFIIEHVSVLSNCIT